MDRDDLRVHVLQPCGDRLGATGSSRNHSGPTADLALNARGHRDDDGSDGLRARERVERPLQERPPPELYEGLRAAGPQPFAGAGGRNDR